MKRNRSIILLTVLGLICLTALVFASCNPSQAEQPPTKYKLTFVVDGNEYATVTTAGNEVITLPTDPVKYGYTFDGWFTDEGTWQTQLTSGSLSFSALTSDLTVFAKFSREVSVACNEILILSGDGVGGNEQVKYYVKPKGTFVTHVMLSNPQNFPILSLTINGSKYESNVFKKGSTSEAIIIDIIAPSESGYYDVILQNIEYDNGEQNVNFDVNKTVKIGVTYVNAPKAEILSRTIFPTKAVFEINIVDIDNVLKGKAYTYLISGGYKAPEQILKVGKNTIVFDNLQMGQTFEFKFHSNVDFFDGKGKRSVTLEEGIFTTPQVFEVNNLAATSNSVEFNIAQNGDVGQIVSVKLYSNGELLQILGNEVKKYTVETLLSGHEYTIEINYKYETDGEKLEGSIVTHFETECISIPYVDIKSLNSTSNKVFFDIVIEDPFSLLTIDKIELYLDDTYVQTAETVDVRMFSNLQSDCKYRIRVTYSYDLNDGRGIHIVSVEDSVMTMPVSVMPIAIEDVVSSKTSISFDIKIVNINALLSIDKIELLLDNVPVQVAQSIDARTFSNLLSDTEYTVAVTYTHYFNDGKDSEVCIISTAARTMAKFTPIVSIKDLNCTQNNLLFDIDIIDFDAILNIDKIELYCGQELVQSGDNTTRGFGNLLSDTDYTIKITYFYDLNDGQGVRTSFIAETTRTLAKHTPTVCIENVISTQTSLKFDVISTDIDNIMSIDNLELFKGTTLVETAANVDVREFTNLLSNNEYAVKVTYSYDLNDGYGVQKNVVTANIKTIAKNIPIVEITSLTSTYTSLGFGIVATDVDEILVINSVELFNGQTVIKTFDKTETMFSVNDLSSGVAYMIQVTYSYDLNDGQGDINESAQITYPTLVEICVSQMTLIGSQGRVGEEINLRISFDVLQDLQISEIFINNQKVKILGGNRKTYVMVNYVTEKAGEQNLSVSKIVYNFAGNELTQSIETTANITVYAYDSLNIRCEMVSANPYEYTGDGLYLYIENPQRYQIYKVNNNTDFIQLSDNEFYITYYNFEHSITSIEYGFDDYGSTTQNLDFKYNCWMNGIHYYLPIYSAEDFLEMNSYGMEKCLKYYILMNDIDLSNFVIEHCLMADCINGNGHTIKGLTKMIDGSKNNDFDLFRNCSIFDLNFEELYIRYENINHPIGLFGDARLYNCSVSGDLSIEENAYFYGVNQYGDSNTFNLNIERNGNYEFIRKNGITLDKNMRIEITDKNEIYYHFSDTTVGYLYCMNDLVESVTIKDGISYIFCDAFSECRNLQNIKFGTSVTVIYGAFAYCFSLKNIYFEGTEEEWAAIKIDAYSPLLNATRYYYSEAEPTLNAEGTAYDGNYWHYNESGEIEVWTKG